MQVIRDNEQQSIKYNQSIKERALKLRQEQLHVLQQQVQTRTQQERHRREAISA